MCKIFCTIIGEKNQQKTGKIREVKIYSLRSGGSDHSGHGSGAVQGDEQRRGGWSSGDISGQESGRDSLSGAGADRGGRHHARLYEHCLVRCGRNYG